nr:hypothetical protein [uncultured Sulfurimonas sp.]
MWIKKLQIAIIEKNADAIDELMKITPKFQSQQEIESAMYLIREAAELIYTLKDETALSMERLKKHIDFLKSTQTSTKNRLDIKL